MRIFLDATVLFSAAKSDGAMSQLLDLLFDAGHECHVDGYVVDEARRNLIAKAPEGDATLQVLTGDRTHVGRFYGKTLGGVAIHSPRSLAEKLFA